MVLNLFHAGSGRQGISAATRSAAFLALSLAFGCLSFLQAAPITLTFDELPFQPVDGLSFMGVTFDFKIGGLDSTDANYNSAGPGTVTFVQDPSLEGNANGVLTLDFAVPTSTIEFGVALGTFLPLTPGFVVDLFDPALAPLGTFPVNTSSLVTFTEAQFTQTGPLVSRVVVSFEPSAFRFALDNLTYEPVPEPSTCLLVALGLGAIVIVYRFSRNGRARVPC